jgi:hypothetical protein
MRKIILFMILLTAGVVYKNLSSAVPEPAQSGLSGPKGTKFMTVESSRPPWEGRNGGGLGLPSVTEMSVYLADLMNSAKNIPGGPSHQSHEITADQVERALDLARRSGIQTGPTLFDPSLKAKIVEP